MRILRAIVNGTEFRCEETDHPTTDIRGDRYTEKRRSQWISKNGEVDDDKACLAAMQTQATKDRLETLRKRLWKNDD